MKGKILLGILGISLIVTIISLNVIAQQTPQDRTTCEKEAQEDYKGRLRACIVQDRNYFRQEAELLKCDMMEKNSIRLCIEDDNECIEGYYPSEKEQDCAEIRREGLPVRCERDDTQDWLDFKSDLNTCHT